MEYEHLIPIELSVKCGDIFFHKEKFTFNCTNCDTNFDRFPAYATHFRTCFKLNIETETDSFNQRFSSQTTRSAKEQSSASKEPFETTTSTTKLNNSKPTELLKLVVNRRLRRRRIYHHHHHHHNHLIALRGFIKRTTRIRIRTRTKGGKRILYNCRACGKKYFTKVAFKAHKLTNNCTTSNLKDALRLAEKNNAIREEVAEGLSQLNPPIGK